METPTEKENVSAAESKRQKRKRSFPTVAVVLLMALSFWAGIEKGSRSYSGSASSSVLDSILSSKNECISDKNGNNSVDFSLFWKSWDLLKDKYVDKGSLNTDEMMYGAIKGMLASTGDPYTTFFDPKENKDFQEELSGSFAGIGAEVGMKDNVLTIIAPLDDSPAQKAGLLAGDKVLKIDGTSTMDMDITQAISLMRGPEDTDVKLTIFRNGGVEQTKEIMIKRDIITVKSVKTEFKDNDIAYIKVNVFGDKTEGEFRQAIDDAVAKKSHGIVIDLRNNPGGYLESAVSMASLMIPKGKVVVMEEDGNGKRTKVYARGGDAASGIETAVLINEGSASASEILSGALRDNRANVTLVGKKSFGKGSVQEPVSVTKDTLVKITVAKWLTPNGKQINHEGIAPDEEVAFAASDREQNKDPQLDRALEVLKEKLKK